jgi:hypothetical protein
MVREKGNSSLVAPTADLKNSSHYSILYFVAFFNSLYKKGLLEESFLSQFLSFPGSPLPVVPSTDFTVPYVSIESYKGNFETTTLVPKFFHFLFVSGTHSIDMPSSNYSTLKCRRGDLLYLTFQRFIEHLLLLRYIFNCSSLEGAFSSSTATLSGTALNSSFGRKLKEQSTISYYIKPLTFHTLSEPFRIFDTNFQRNSFYLSKIKDLSKPFLHFSDSTTPQLPKNNYLSVTSSSQKDGSSLHKNLSSRPSIYANMLKQASLQSGPRLLVKRSNNNLNLE